MLGNPVLAAAMVSVSVPLAWWALSRPVRLGVDPARSLRNGGQPHDVRDLELARSAGDRVLTPVVDHLLGVARRLTPSGAADRVETRIAAAGLAWSLDRYYSLKLLLLAVGGVLGVVHLAASPGILSLLLAIGVAAAGWFGPDVVLHDRASHRRDTIRRELPDTIDQVTIAVEAGLGFEAALVRVAGNGTGELAAELTRALQDVQLGVPRTEALGRLATRTGLPEMHRLVAAIQQSERYGVPIVNILRVQAADLRERRRQRAEETAMKIPVKVVLPLVFCILPTLFIVVLGPALARFISD
jgi:tight adherence protein C